jgi:hypothetical protein
VFTADDITATAPFPRATVQRFDVARDGSPCGWVTVPTAALLDRTVDLKASIADRLNDYERDHGSPELADALAGGLSLA